MPLFLENPPSGGGSGQDRFAPKYVVGNTANGDSATAYSTDGFYYFPDPGDGSGIAAALGAAFANPGDVWIRPGGYVTASNLLVPVGCTVRGSGPSTVIASATNQLDQSLFTLSNQSSLRDMALAHNIPLARNDSLQFGVVDLRAPQTPTSDTIASCENVQILTNTVVVPTNKTLFAGFYVQGTPGGAAYKTTLNLRDCSVQYGANTSANDYRYFLVGYRGLNASLNLDNCTATAVADKFGTQPDGACGVVDCSTLTSGTEFGGLNVQGGKFYSFRTGFYGICGANGNYPTIVTGARIFSSQKQATGDAGVYLFQRGRALVSNCYIENLYGWGCVVFDPQGFSSTNTGSVIGNTLISDNSRAWYSLNSGYHTIIGNTYKEFAASVSSPNDEVAHNIAI